MSETVHGVEIDPSYQHLRDTYFQYSLDSSPMLAAWLNSISVNMRLQSEYEKKHPFISLYRISHGKDTRYQRNIGMYLEAIRETDRSTDRAFNSLLAGEIAGVIALAEEVVSTGITYTDNTGGAQID